MNEKFREEFKKAISDHFNEITEISNDEQQQIDHVVREFKTVVEKREQTEYRPPKNMAQYIAVIAAAVVGILIGTFIFSDSPSVKAFKTDTSNFFTSLFDPNTKVDEHGQRMSEYDSFDELQKNLTFQLPRFTWLPEGYMLTLAEKSQDASGNIIVSLTYENPSASPQGYISISIVQNSSAEVESRSEGWRTQDYESIEVNGVQAAISTDAPYSASLIYQYVFRIDIATSESRDGLHRIMENIQ